MKSSNNIYVLVQDWGPKELNRREYVWTDWYVAYTSIKKASITVLYNEGGQALDSSRKAKGH